MTSLPELQLCKTAHTGWKRLSLQSRFRTSGAACLLGWGAGGLGGDRRLR
jgi:hypothetical protein